MSHEQKRNHGEPAGPPRSRAGGAAVRVGPFSEEERLARVARWRETVRELEGMTDETDTPELWDEVLRNLGVDPATGRGLPGRWGVRI
jgi:hypothetical protein